MARSCPADRTPSPPHPPRRAPRVRGARPLPADGRTARRLDGHPPGVCETYRLAETTARWSTVSRRPRSLGPSSISAPPSGSSGSRRARPVLAAKRVTIAELQRGDRPTWPSAAALDPLRSERSWPSAGRATSPRRPPTSRPRSSSSSRSRGPPSRSGRSTSAGRCTWIGRVDFLWRGERSWSRPTAASTTTASPTAATTSVGTGARAAGWVVLRFSDRRGGPTDVGVRTVRRALAVAGGSPPTRGRVAPPRTRSRARKREARAG